MKRIFRKKGNRSQSQNWNQDYDQVSDPKKKNKKKDAFYTFIAILVVVGAYALDIGIGLLLKAITAGTNSLLSYYLYVIHNASLFSTFLFFGLIVFLIWLFTSDDRKGVFKALKKKMHIWLPVTIGIMLAVTLIYNCFDVKNRWRFCSINGERPSRNEFHFAVLKDVFSGETKTVELDIKDIGADYRIYSYTTYTKGRSHTHRGATYYIDYKTDAGEEYTSIMLEYTGVEFLKELQSFRRLKPIMVTLEYYVNSGVIKTIDGCSPYDEEGLSILLQLKKDEYELNMTKEDRIEEDTDRIKKADSLEKTRMLTIIMETLDNSNSQGKNFEEVKAGIRAQDVPFDGLVKTVYISTKAFKPGEIAFYDNPNKKIYVVKDALAEEMVQLPEFDRKDSAEEIINKLEAKGIKYKCYAFTDRDLKDQKLVNYACEPGIFIPKDYEYWFSVD